MKTIAVLLFSLISLTGTSQVINLPIMNTARGAHEIVCLGEESLVVMGGSDDGIFLSSVEVYDGSSWTEGESMSVPRYSFTAHATGADQLIVIGGWDGAVTNHAATEIYYPSLDAWDAGPTLSTGRSNHRSITLGDGRILVTGGYDGSTDLTSCEIIDPSDWSVSQAADMNFGRSSHELVLLDDGHVLAIGGFNPSLDFQMDECERYDPVLNEWTVVGALNSGRDNLSAFKRPDGQVAALGGRFFNGGANLFEGQISVELFDPENGNWTAGSDLVEGGSYGDAYWIDAADQAIFLAGVNETGNGVTTTYSDNQFNEFGPDAWSVGENYLTGDRFRFASCQLPSGGIVVSGGFGSASVQVIQPATAISELDRKVPVLYPNPARERVQFSGVGEHEHWMIRDQMGRSVLSGKGNRGDVSPLDPGSYFWSLVDGGAPALPLVVH